MIRAALAFGLVVLAGPGLSQEVSLQFPEGAVQVASKQQDFARYSVPVAPAKLGDVETVDLEGEVLMSIVQFPTSTTLEALMASLRAQLFEQGYLALLDCTARACGGFDFRQAVVTLPPPDMVVDLAQFGFLAVRHPQDARVIVVLASLTRDVSYAQVVEIAPAEVPGDATVERVAAPAMIVAEPKAEAAAETRVETAALTDDLFADHGAFVLEGLVFETGSAALTDDDYPGLRALAEFLLDNPDSRVVLVGHTDIEGALSANIALSRRRAEAVRARLIETFSVPSGQVQADGVGYLAPRATNTTQDGRLVNRRVEAVLMKP